MKLFINIVMKRIYLFYTVAWNCRKKKDFRFAKKKISPTFKRTGSAEKLSCQSMTHWWNRQKPGQHSLTSVERPLSLRSDFVNVWRHARLVVYICMLLLRSYTDLPDDLTVCSEVLSCFFDHPSIDSNKKMSLSPFKGCFEVSILFLLRGVN